MAGEFGMVLRKLRRDANLTFREVSDNTGINTSSLCRYELGKVVPDSDNIIKLSEVFKVDRNVLLKMAQQAQKARKAGKTTDPRKLLESLRKIDRDPDYPGKDISMNDLKEKLNITDTNHPDVIKRIRKRFGLSMAELAKGFGVSISLVSRIESGERRLSRKALLYLYRLENTGIYDFNKNTKHEVVLTANLPGVSCSDFDAASPQIIPVYESLIRKIAKDYIFISKNCNSVWGVKIVAVIASTDLCYKYTIKRGDLLIVSMDMKPNTGDLCVVTDYDREYIETYNNIKNADYSVILQIVRTIWTG